MTVPSPNGSNGSGRDSVGRFTSGNAGGPGNPYAKRTAEIRAAFVDAITTEELTALARKLYQMAMTGDVRAACELLNRILGRPTEAPPVDGNHSPQYQVLVTTTQEAIRRLEEKRNLSNEDPHRGRRRLPKGD